MNAHAALRVPPQRRVSNVQPDGAMLVTPEQLARLGNGDVERGRRELRMILAAERQQHVSDAPPVRPLSVRIAGPADEGALLELLVGDLRENAVHVAPIDEDSVRDVIRACTEKKGGIAGVIDGPDKKPIAVIVLLPAKWWWSKGWYLQEIVTYVRPDHRKSHAFDDLCAFAKWAADGLSKNAGYRYYLLCGVLATRRVREKMLAYRRKFVQAGLFCVWPSPFPQENEK